MMPDMDGEQIARLILEDGELRASAILMLTSSGNERDQVQRLLENGFEATAAIRKVRLSRPIVALTANAILGDRQRCLDAGMDDYLTKPVGLDTLARAVAHWAKPEVAMHGFRM